MSWVVSRSAALVSYRLAVPRLVLIVVLLAGAARSAAADTRLDTIYVEMPAGAGTVVEGPVDQPVLFLNRCAAGCTVTPGWEDSRTNRSSIIDQPSFIPPFDDGDEAWNAVVQCVRAMYSDFGILITDVDPGEHVAHFEAIVAGSPEDVGFPFNVGGVAPFTCGIIDNSITFTFAGRYGDPQQICHTIAQESAHAFGLDHEYMCEDPMTYLGGCGAKCFQNADAACGEYGERRCNCGGDTQNSWQELEDMFGPGSINPETLRISGPDEGATVRRGFHVNIEVGVACIVGVEVWVDDIYAGEVSTWPFVFNTPPNIEVGPATVKAIATDADGNTVETTIEVTIDDSGPEPEPEPDPELDPDPDPEQLPEPQPDCGCAAHAAGTSSGNLFGWLLLLGVVSLGLRRR